MDYLFRDPISPENSPPETGKSTCILNLGGLDAKQILCVSFKNQTEAFHYTDALFIFMYRISNLCFSHVSQDPFGVAVGGTLGHCLCTGLAVIGGRMIAQKISVRTGEGLKTNLEHVDFFVHPIIMFLFFPL